MVKSINTAAVVANLDLTSRLVKDAIYHLRQVAGGESDGTYGEFINTLERISSVCHARARQEEGTQEGAGLATVAAPVLPTPSVAAQTVKVAPAPQAAVTKPAPAMAAKVATADEPKLAKPAPAPQTAAEKRKAERAARIKAQVATKAAKPDEVKVAPAPATLVVCHGCGQSVPEAERIESRCAKCRALPPVPKVSLPFPPKEKTGVVKVANAAASVVGGPAPTKLPESYKAMVAMGKDSVHELAGKFGVKTDGIKWATLCSAVWAAVKKAGTAEAAKPAGLAVKLDGLTSPATESTHKAGTILVADGKGGVRPATEADLWAALEAMGKTAAK